MRFRYVLNRFMDNHFHIQSDEYIEVEVAYATSEVEKLYKLKLQCGSSAKDAITQSGVLNDYPEITLEHIGVFGRRVRPEHLLSHGDRVEIYRPLLVDPKEVRRELARQGKSIGRSKT